MKVEVSVPAAVALLLMSTPALAQGPRGPQHASPGSPGRAEPSGSWLAEVSQGIRAAEYRFSPVRGEAGVWSAPNRGQGLRSRVHPSGIEVFPRTVNADGEGAAWTLSLGTARFGRAGDLRELEPGRVRVEGARAELARGALVEWFENGESGIEHGWTIERRPGGIDPLRIVLAVEGLALRLDAGGRSGVFVDARGVPRLAYRHLLAWDARGVELEARLVPAPSGAAIRVADEGARYPITVDPLLSSPAWTAEPDQAGVQLGFSVSAAGDVNGDGYSDVIVGANQFDNGEAGEGRAFVYHGSASGLGVSAAWTAESNQVGALFGESVSTAGDVNGDGFSDVIVGARWYDNGETNEGRAFVYHGSASGLGGSSAWTAESNQADAQFGSDVSTAGDVNGDGYSDVIVGAPVYENGETAEGRIFVFHGSAAGLSASPAWTAEPDQAIAELGSSVSAAGDVNGDGYSDVIAGANRYTNGHSCEGRAFVYHGSASGLSAGAAWTAESNQTGANYGQDVSTAGDVNGDGYSDVIVGAYTYDNGENAEGRAYAYHGSASGLGSVAVWTVESNQAEASLGFAVSTAGDVNGDGYSDVIVGAVAYDNVESDEGRAFVYHGSADGLGTVATWTAEPDQTLALFGNEVSTAGDVNGDGFSDVIVGARLYDNGELNEGRAYVYHGSADGLAEESGWTEEADQDGAGLGFSVSGAGDVDGDGYSDVIVGAPFYDNGESNEGGAFVYLGSSSGPGSSPDDVLEVDQAGAFLGWSVSGAGDVNGDGYADVIAGAPFYDDGQMDEGGAFVWLGTQSGMASTPVWTGTSDQADAAYGISVSEAGDVNGDGLGDVLVGAYVYDDGETDEGAAFLYLGSGAGPATSPAWMATSDQAFAHMGRSVSTAGDVNADGYSDVIVGAESYDNPENNEGAAFVYLGSGKGPATASTILDPDQTNSNFGYSVSSAGDVNGDGYADVIVGAHGYDNGETNEGGAFVHHGSAAGVAGSAAWTAELDQANALFGQTVSGAGDVNGDGYADVIAGAPFYDFSPCHEDEGGAFVFLGSASGLSSLPAWFDVSVQDFAEYGFSVAGVGDVNGDGFDDVLVGSRNYDNGEPNEGRVFAYLGNGGSGWMSALQQGRVFGPGPIGFLGRSDHYHGLRPRATFDRSLAGFTWATPFAPEVAIEWEVEEVGSLYDGDRVNAGPSQVYTGSPLSLTGLAGGLTPGRAYLWKARLRTNNPLLPVTPWVSVPGNAPTEWTLRTKPVGGNGKDPEGTP